jgi:hypothetical protein
MNRHAVLIERLGGATELAMILGINVAAVHKWPLRGIPAKHWHKIMALDPSVSAMWLERTKPRGVQAKPRRGRNGR